MLKKILTLRRVHVAKEGGRRDGKVLVEEERHARANS